MLLLFLCLGLAGAHMPVFPGKTSAAEPYSIEHLDTKSWGIYGTLTTDVVWLKIEAEKGDEMTISMQRSGIDGYYDAAIWGPGMSQVNCTPGWYGWTHGVSGVFATRDLSELPASVKEAIGTSEALVLHGDAKEDPEYEPFGVNLYWPIGGCKDKYPATGTYNVALVHDFTKTVKFSLGVGMAESFNVDELILMPYVMLRTFVWGGRSAVSVISILLLGTALSYCAQLLALGRRGYAGIGPRTIVLASHLAWIGASGLVGSAAVWITQILWCLEQDSLNNSVYLAIGVHVALMLVLAGLVLGLYDASSIKAWALLPGLVGSLALFLAWQAYVVFPSLLILAALLHAIA